MEAMRWMGKRMASRVVDVMLMRCREPVSQSQSQSLGQSLSGRPTGRVWDQKGVGGVTVSHTPFLIPITNSV